MSRLLAKGRYCFRQWPLPGSRQQFSSQTFRARFYQSSAPSRSQQFSRPRVLLYASASLTPAVFVHLSTNGDESGKSGEERMLAASRAEIDETVPRMLQNSSKIRRKIYFFLDTWIYEPACTALRFVHLLIIFVPVIATIPVIWIGRRVTERDNERTGTLWWYGFLVSSMERAGAAFIKVRMWGWHTRILLTISSSWGNGPLREQISFPARCVV